MICAICLFSQQKKEGVEELTRERKGLRPLRSRVGCATDLLLCALGGLGVGEIAERCRYILLVFRGGYVNGSKGRSGRASLHLYCWFSVDYVSGSKGRSGRASVHFFRWVSVDYGGGSRGARDERLCIYLVGFQVIMLTAAKGTLTFWLSSAFRA